MTASSNPESTHQVTAQALQQVLDALRHCKVLNIRAQAINGRQVTLELPYAETLVGNPITGVLHGGALTTLLDTTCGMSLLVAMGELIIAPTLDLRIDYMTSATPGHSVYARAEVYRITKHVIFCRGIAYQDDDSKPIAHCVATFMRLPKQVWENAMPAGGVLVS